jgi:hypothetical protein
MVRDVQGNYAQIVDADIRAGDAIVQAIDRVLLSGALSGRVQGAGRGARPAGRASRLARSRPAFGEA